MFQACIDQRTDRVRAEALREIGHVPEVFILWGEVVEPHDLEIELTPIARAQVNSRIAPEGLLVSVYGLTVRRRVGVAEFDQEAGPGEALPT